MKPTSIKISISPDGLLPEQSIELGRTLMPGIPKKLMSALDFEKVDGDRKNTTFIGILPVFVVIGEKTQEIEVELTVAHPELRDKVVEIFTAEPPADPAAKPAVKSAAKSAPAAPKTKTAAPASKAKPAAAPKKKSAPAPATKSAPKSASKPAPKPVAKS
ncbi:MAG: hypothetical protein OXF52_00900, partial [Candidatus Dadabacteria bacterium]|nr:hypothetical protein [Candidatus Dadabacteria bacterium]